MAQRETDDLFYRLQSVRPRPVNIWRPIRRPACTTDYRLTRQCQTDRQERMRQSPPVLLARVCRYSPVSRAWERQSQSMATRGCLFLLFLFLFFWFLFFVLFFKKSFLCAKRKTSLQRPTEAAHGEPEPGKGEKRKEEQEQETEAERSEIRKERLWRSSPDEDRPARDYGRRALS